MIYLIIFRGIFRQRRLKMTIPARRAALPSQMPISQALCLGVSALAFYNEVAYA